MPIGTAPDFLSMVGSVQKKKGRFGPGPIGTAVFKIRQIWFLQGLKSKKSVKKVVHKESFTDFL